MQQCEHGIYCLQSFRAPDKVHIFIATMPVSSPITLFETILTSGQTLELMKK